MELLMHRVEFQLRQHLDQSPGAPRGPAAEPVGHSQYTSTPIEPNCGQRERLSGHKLSLSIKETNKQTTV